MTKDEQEKLWEVRKMRNSFKKEERTSAIEKLRAMVDLRDFCISQGGHFWNETEYERMASGVGIYKRCLGCGALEELEFVNFDGSIRKLKD